MKIKVFREGMRVRVVKHGSNSDYDGRAGQVTRVGALGNWAWIRTDEPLPGRLRVFSPGAGRQADSLMRVYADECEAI